MASPTVPFIFSNSTVADATQVNDNFTAILALITDGTIDYSINSLTLGGTLTANGAVNLGNAASDDLTITASLAKTLAIKTKNTYSIGADTLYLANIYSTTAYVSALSALTDVAAGITCNPLLTCADGFLITETAITDPASSDGNIYSGTYTPTLTDGSNITASTPSVCQYLRVGNTVTVSGTFAVSLTANNTTSTLQISLPIASDFSAARQAAGVAVYQASTISNSGYGQIGADSTNNTLTVRLSDGLATTSHTYYFHVSYQII